MVEAMGELETAIDVVIMKCKSMETSRKIEICFGEHYLDGLAHLH